MSRLIILLALINSGTCLAQFDNLTGIWNSDLDKAIKLYEDKLYEGSINYFSKVMEISPLNVESNLMIADCYRRLGMYEQAKGHYMAVEQFMGLEKSESLINYAQTLLSTGHLEEARRFFEKYDRLNPGNILVQNRIEGLDNYNNFFVDSAYNLVEPSVYNSEHREYGARPYSDGVAFTSSREKDLIIQHDHSRSSESLIDIYSVKPTSTADTSSISPSRIKLPQHFKSNDGPFTQVGPKVIVSRSNGRSKAEKTNTLGLYFYSLSEGNWVYESDFAYNSDAYSVTHPALSKNGDTLYFASDMPGGFGGIDVYYSILIQGSWTPPLNLGALINTLGDEQFPYHDNTLYFSSNGHPGIGGFDIYKVTEQEGQQTVVNLGFPINSGYDDFSIYIDDCEGYFASNRPGGSGLDDIYTLKILPKPPPAPKFSLVDIDILDSLSGFALDSVRMEFVGAIDTSTYETDAEGRLQLSLRPDLYELSLVRSDYKPMKMTVEVKEDRSNFETIFLPPNMAYVIIAPDSIMFKFGDFALAKTAELELDVIIESMKKYPMLNLTIEAHTDSRGKSGYNMWLSEMRATSTANYLIEEGLSMDRITLKGYGESQLLNQCKDGVKCSPYEHAVNRRIEFLLQKE